MRVRFTEQAAAELAEILEYLQGRSPAGANSVRDAVLRAARLLAHFPESGALTDVESVRELTLPRQPYKLYYSIGPDEVWIVHMRDARRKPWEIEAPDDGKPR